MLMHDDDVLPVMDERDAYLPGTYELMRRMSKTHFVVVDSSVYARLFFDMSNIIAERRALFKPQRDFALTWADQIRQFWCWLFSFQKSRLIPLIYREHC